MAALARRISAGSLLLVALAATGCNATSTGEDAARSDSGVDSGPLDSGPTDGGPSEAGSVCTLPPGETPVGDGGCVRDGGQATDGSTGVVGPCTCGLTFDAAI